MLVLVKVYLPDFWLPLEKKSEEAAISSVSIKLEKHSFFIPINSFYKEKKLGQVAVVA